MKINLKNAKKLSRESQKKISGGGRPCSFTGCFSDYLSDGTGRCVVPPCTNFGIESQNADGRWQCCY